MKTRLFFIVLVTLVSVFSIRAQKLRVGVIPYKTEQKIRDTYPKLFDYVTEKLGDQLELSLVPEDELGYKLDQGELDIGVFTVFPYLAAKSDFPALEVFASHMVQGQNSYEGAILTMNASSISSITDLKDKRIGFVKATSTSGYHLPKSIIEEYDLVLTDRQMVFTGGHEEAIESLFAGDVAAIGIDLEAFSRGRYDPDDVRILTSYEIPYHAYVYSPHLQVEKREQIANVMFKADKDPALKEVLQTNPLRIKAWRPRNESYYNSLRRYLREVRIKPHVQVTLEVQERTKLILAESGDFLSLLGNDIEHEVKQSGRYDLKTNDPLHTMRVKVSLFSVQDLFHYQIMVEDKQVGKGDITLRAVKSALPKIILQDILKSQPIETELLRKEEEWFATYGTDDGINLRNYRFEKVDPEGEVQEIDKSKISISQKNLHFKGLQAERADLLRIVYIPADIKDDGSEVLVTPTHNIFSAKFWRQDYWDKLGLILGVVFAIISALVGRIFARRKQRRFKNILYETNELIKDFIKDHLKFEARVIEQKEQISRLFENGTINENQFMILNNRIEEVSVLMDRITPHEVKLTNDQKEEIESIIVDGQITEKEFSRIMGILRKS